MNFRMNAPLPIPEEKAEHSAGCSRYVGRFYIPAAAKPFVAT
jgi:hypothetical protein